MKWFIRRVSVLGLVFIIVCSAGALAGRIEEMPNMFERLGFRMCDGEACFRGIKLGTDWQTAQDILPAAVAEGDYLELPVNIDNVMGIRVGREANDKTVQFIGIDLADPRRLKARVPPVETAGTIVAQYGAPCRMDLYSGNGVPRIMLFIYPTLTVFVDVANGVQPSTADFRLKPESPVVGFWIAGTKNDGRCANTTSQYVGPWQGFASTDVYRARYSRVLNSKQH